jgi:hypothetical protein
MRHRASPRTGIAQIDGGWHGPPTLQGCDSISAVAPRRPRRWLVTDRTVATPPPRQPPALREEGSSLAARARRTLEDMASYGLPARRRRSNVSRAAHGLHHHVHHHRSVTHRASTTVGYGGRPHHTVKRTVHASVAHHHGRKGHTTVHTVSHHHSVKHHAHPGSLPWGHSWGHGGDMGALGHSGGHRRAVGARRGSGSGFGRMPAMAMPAMPSGFGF